MVYKVGNFKYSINENVITIFLEGCYGIHGRTVFEHQSIKSVLDYSISDYSDSIDI